MFAELRVDRLWDSIWFSLTVKSMEKLCRNLIDKSCSFVGSFVPKSLHIQILLRVNLNLSEDVAQIRNRSISILYD